jgi:transcriptional regulator with XRE-family HTH domain
MKEREETEFLEKLGQRISHFRQKRKMTQEQLGNSIGMKRQGITRLEAGGTRVSIVTLKEISDVLEVPLYKLVRIE